MRREQYLQKKSARAAADAVEHAAEESKSQDQLFHTRLEEKQQHIRDLEQQVADLKLSNANVKRDLQEEKKKTKADALSEYQEDIRRLQQAQNNAKASAERWEDKRAKLKTSCQKLGLYKLSSVSKKKILAKNKKLSERIAKKVEGKADLRRALNDAKSDAVYWEHQHSVLLEGNNHAQIHSHARACA